MSIARGGHRLAIPLRREKMLYQSRITNATKRTTLVLVFLCICGTTILAAADNSNATTPGKAVANSEAMPSEQTAQQKPSPSPVASPSVTMSPTADSVSQSQQ